MAELFKFYFSILFKLFNLLASWVLAPGVNYLTFFLVGFLIVLVLRPLFGAYKLHYFKSLTRDIDDRAEYKAKSKAKHTYVPKHAKR